MQTTILIIIGITAFLLGKYTAKKNLIQKGLNKTFATFSKSKRESIRQKSKKALSERTEERKEKILEYIEHEIEHQKQLLGCDLEDPLIKESLKTKGVTRNQIEELLNVSDSTARKYLNELEKENKIQQIGESKSTSYILK